MSDIITITTPIFYPSGKTHIGTVTTILISHILCQFNKLAGRNSQLLTGLDENSIKVAECVKKLNLAQPNLTIQKYLDSYANTLKNLLDEIKVKYDVFIRTSSSHHKRKVQTIWKQLYDSGFIYKGYYKGYYSIKDEAFFLPQDIVNGLAPTGAPVQLIQQECYYFRASKFYDDILKSMKNRCYPKKTYNLLSSYMKTSLKDLCISRKNNHKDQTNQILVPGDDDHVVYVWFDALLNYLHIGERWNGRVIHVLAKDIAQFHGVFWPAILKSLGYKLFDSLLIHQWWILEDKKISKSSNNTNISLDFLINNYPIDLLRFCCFKNNLIGQDKQFVLEEIITDFNSFVVDQFSNLVYRSWSLAYRKKITWNSEKIHNKYTNCIDAAAFDGHIDQIFYKLTNWTQYLNKYFDKNAIWNNLHMLPDFMQEVEQLSKYWSVVLVDAQNVNWQEKPVKLYTKLSLIDLDC